MKTDQFKHSDSVAIYYMADYCGEPRIICHPSGFPPDSLDSVRRGWIRPLEGLEREAVAVIYDVNRDCNRPLMHLAPQSLEVLQNLKVY